MSLLSKAKLLWTMGSGVVGGLPEADERRDPIELFSEWFRAARESGLFLPEAFALATASPEGRPSNRMVLLKTVDERGFVFFTNYASRKAREVEANPWASLCFHWGVLERQVRAEGRVERLGAEESDVYFASRARGSRLGAWASRQSETLEAREALERRMREIEARFHDGDIPRPEFWGGYLVRPVRIEFWQGRADRLHDRLIFERGDGDVDDDSWRTRRLHP